MGMNQLPTHGQRSPEVPKSMRVWYGSSRYSTRLTGNSALWNSTWRSSWRSMAYQMVLDAYWGAWTFLFTVWRPHRSVSPCELELSMCVRPIAVEMSWLPAADPHVDGSIVISASSMSMCWQGFFHTRHRYLDNWIKPLISTASVSQIMVQVTLQITLHTYIWSISTFDWLFNSYMGNAATQWNLHPAV